MNLSASAIHLSTIPRIPFIDHAKWVSVAKSIHPQSKHDRSLVMDIEYYKVDGVEDAVALWHDEHQMGYVIIPTN